jgi:nicotinamide riboside transporter PnuC
MEVLGTIASVLAIAGVVLNNRRRTECFYLWMVSNSLCLVIHVIVGVWSLAMRDVIFFFLALEGLKLWKKSL